MPVTVTADGTPVALDWTPEDDPNGYLARAVTGDQLAYALEAVGRVEPGMYEDAGIALQAAAHTTSFARMLERRAALQVVHLRDHHGLSWRRIAVALHDDPERQSTVRRQYESGRRHIGI